MKSGTENCARHASNITMTPLFKKKKLKYDQLICQLLLTIKDTDFLSFFLSFFLRLLNLCPKLPMLLNEKASLLDVHNCMIGKLDSVYDDFTRSRVRLPSKAPNEIGRDPGLVQIR